MPQEKFVVGRNIEATIDGNMLTLRIDMSKDFGPSSTGKNTIIASTGGNVVMGATGVKLGLNAYRAPK